MVSSKEVINAVHKGKIFRHNPSHINRLHLTHIVAARHSAERAKPFGGRT